MQNNKNMNLSEHIDTQTGVKVVAVRGTFLHSRNKLHMFGRGD